MPPPRPDPPDHAGEVRRRLADPVRLCRALGLLDGYKPGRQARGLLIRCPVHGDRTPSCSVVTGPDRTVQVRCFACGFSGDALHLIAVAHHLDLRRDFRQVLALGASLGGLALGEDEGSHRSPLTPPLPAAPHEPPRVFPPPGEVRAVWADAGPLEGDRDARALLTRRGLEAATVDLFGLARVIRPGAALPRWARYQGQSWAETGHRLLVPMHDEGGVMRSLRAWRVGEGESPKRLPPAGHRASGLVMANPLGRLVLETGALPLDWPAGAPLRVVVAEGEPDFLTWATRFSDANELAPAVLGLVQGSWSEGVAARLPDGARVTVRTDRDPAGDGYAETVRRSLVPRCTVLRPRGPS